MISFNSGITEIVQAISRFGHSAINSPIEEYSARIDSFHNKLSDVFRFYTLKDGIFSYGKQSVSLQDVTFFTGFMAFIGINHLKQISARNSTDLSTASFAAIPNPLIQMRTIPYYLQSMEDGYGEPLNFEIPVSENDPVYVVFGRFTIEALKFYNSPTPKSDAERHSAMSEIGIKYKEELRAKREPVQNYFYEFIDIFASICSRLGGAECIDPVEALNPPPEFMYLSKVICFLRGEMIRETFPLWCNVHALFDSFIDEVSHENHNYYSSERLAKGILIFALFDPDLRERTIKFVSDVTGSKNPLVESPPRMEQNMPIFRDNLEGQTWSVENSAIEEGNLNHWDLGELLVIVESVDGVSRTAIEALEFLLRRYNDNSEQVS